MPGFWEPPTRETTRPRQRLLAENSMTGHEYPAPHILASPPGTQAPAHYINYTPDTNEVHGPGSLAPQDRLNYSLLPHDELRPKSMGAGIDWGTTVGPGIANPGMPPGSEQGGRYSPTQALRDNTFSPGQPPIAQHPFGTGPGPQIQAAGPDIRDFDQRGSMSGNASSFGAGQEGRRPDRDITQGGWTGLDDDPADPNAGAVTPSQARPAAPTPSQPATDDQRIGEAAAGPAPSGYRYKIVRSAADAQFPQGRPAFLWLVPDDPSRPNRLVQGYSPSGNPDPLTGMPSTLTLPEDIRKDIEGRAGTSGGADNLVVTTIVGSDGKSKRVVVDKTNPTKPITVGDEPGADMPRGNPGDRKEVGEGEAVTVMTVNAQGNWEEDKAATARARQVAKDKARAAIDKDTADNDAQILEAELRYDQAMGTTPFFSTFEDAEGQTWLLNQNTGHRMRVGKPDAAKKRIQLGNTLLGIKDDGKAEVLYEAPKDRIIKEYNGITYEYDPRDPKGTMKELFRDPYWKETQELGLEKTRADIAKAKADVETGKIGALEARSRIEKDLLELEHPKTEALGSGDFIVRRGGKATVHYYGGDTKTFEAGPLPESTRSAIGRMRESLSGLDKPAAPAASTSVSKTGAETAPSARIEVTEVKPTEKTAGEEMGGAGERFKPGWPGSDPRLSGTLRPPSKQTTSSGDIAHYDEHGNLTGIDYLKTAPPHYGEEGYPGSEGYEAEAGLPKNPNWMAEEEEDEYGAGADMDPREGNWWDIDPQRYKDFINWLRQHGQEHEASQPEERFWDPEHPQIQGGGGNMSPPDLEGHPLMRGIIGLGREDIERASPEERFDVANSRDLAPRGPSDWTSEPSLEGDTQYPRDPNRPEETIGTSEVTRRRNPSDVFEEGAELWQERSAGGDPDAITNADRLRRDFPNAPFPENFDEWWPDDQVKFVNEWGQSLPPEEQDRLRQAQVDRLNERLAREREDDFDPESRRREMYGMDRDLEDDLYQPSERTGDPDDFNPSGPDQWAAWEKATERFRHPSLFEDNPGIEHDLPDGFFDLSPEDQQAFVDQWQTRKRAEWEQQASPEEQEQIERARQDFLRDVQGWDPIKEPPGDKPFIYDPSRPEKPPVDEGPVGRDDIENWLWHLAPGEDWGDRNNSTIFDPSEIKGGHTPAPPWHEILNQPSIFKPPSLPTGGHIPVPLPKLPGGHAPGPEIKLPDIVTSIKQRLGAGQGPGEPMGASPAPMGAPPGMGQPAGGQMGGWQPPVPPGEVAGIGHRFGQPMNEGEPFHSGVDLQAQEGAPTVAPADGIVEEVRNDPDGLGLTVIVRDQQGMQHKLGHLSGTDAYRGMVVAKGQNLAQVGSSGNTTGSHLHWAVRDQQGQPQDPTPALGPMGNLPPVPGTEMMGPPGGTGSPPGAAGGMPALPPGLEGGVTPPQPGDIAKSMGMGQDVDLYWDPHNMGAGADGDDDPGEVIGITPSQQANIDAENKRIDMERETRMAEVAQRREAENNRHQEAVAKLEQDWKIHQDNARLQAEKQAEDARHNQAMEAIERERIQADIEIQQMRDANAIRLQQMQQGNQIYLQQGEQAFADFQKQQEMRMEILGSALKNPWMQRLSGMTPGPNYQGAAVPGGQNISNLVNQILTPYDADKYGWQNAPGFLGLDQANAGAAGALPQPGQAGYEEGDMYAYQQQGGAAGGAAQGGAQGGAAGQPALFQQGGGGAQAGQQMGGQNWTYDSAMGAVQGGQGGGSVGAQMAGGGDQGLEYGQNAPATFGDWRAWDPFQKAAYRANIEALGPGAWEQVGQQMADRYAASGGTPDVTAMQAAGGGELGRAGAEMTGELWGQAPEQFWNEQNRQWSRARGPQVQQKLTGQYRV